MSTHSSSNQLCSQQLDDILDPDSNKFEKLIYQMISKDEDQVSQSKALFDFALRSRPDSLLLALSELLSSCDPLLCAEAAKHLGEFFTYFFSSIFLEETTIDTLKSDLLSASRNQVLVSDVRNHLLRTISDFHATGTWPELLTYLFECVDSQSYYFQEYAFLVFKSLAENSNSNAALIPHLDTFQKIFSECMGNSSSWDAKIAALDASISFVEFIPNRNDPNRFDYLCRLMMKILIEALNSESEYKTEDILHLLIKLAKTEPWFFERHSTIVLTLMLKIAFTVDDPVFERLVSFVQLRILNIAFKVDDSLEVNIRHFAIEFLMALVEKAPSMISEDPTFIMRLFNRLMYMLFDIECMDADADAIASAAVADNLVAASRYADYLLVTSLDAAGAAAPADNDEDGDGEGDGDEVGNFFEWTNYILGKEFLSKLSTLLDEKKIFKKVLLFFSSLLGTSIWQKRHAVLIAIPEIAKGCHKVMLENLEQIVAMVLCSLSDSHPRVCLAGINAIRQLSVDLAPELQTKQLICLSQLLGVMNDSRRPKLQAPATSALLNFIRNGTKNIIDVNKWTIMDEFRKFLESHFPNLLEKSAVRMLSQNIDLLLRRPLESPEYLSSLLDSNRYTLSKTEVTELKRLINVIS